VTGDINLSYNSNLEIRSRSQLDYLYNIFRGVRTKFNGVMDVVHTSNHKMYYLIETWLNYTIFIHYLSPASYSVVRADLEYRAFQKKSFTMVFQMLLCDECYENVYTLKAYKLFIVQGVEMLKFRV
jgi:hypothetical protein